MKKDSKRKLYEIFEKVNKVSLKEWYDDEYFAGPEKIKEFNPEDIREVKELFTLLSVDGIEDIYDVYPKWLVDMLKDDGHIHENPQYYAWEFTEEGREYFEDPNDLQEYLLDKERNSGSDGNDSEAPFLRGNEPMSEGSSLFPMGARVKVSDGSGLDSNKTGTVVSPREVKTDGRGVPVNVQGAYKPVDWNKEVAVKLDDGELITMFKNRLNRID